MCDNYDSVTGVEKTEPLGYFIRKLAGGAMLGSSLSQRLVAEWEAAATSAA